MRERFRARDLEGQGWPRTTGVSQCQCSQVQCVLGVEAGVRWALREAHETLPNLHTCVLFMLFQGTPHSLALLSIFPTLPLLGD